MPESKSAQARAMRDANPGMKPYRIAIALGMDPGHCRDALSRKCLPRTRKPRRTRKIPLPQKQLCAVLPFELAERVAAEAHRLGCSQSDVMRGALVVWMAAADKARRVECAEAAE